MDLEEIEKNIEFWYREPFSYANVAIQTCSKLISRCRELEEAIGRHKKDLARYMMHEDCLTRADKELYAVLDKKHS